MLKIAWLSPPFRLLRHQTSLYSSSTEGFFFLNSHETELNTSISFLLPLLFFLFSHTLLTLPSLCPFFTLTLSLSLPSLPALPLFLLSLSLSFFLSSFCLTLFHPLSPFISLLLISISFPAFPLPLSLYLKHTFSSLPVPHPSLSLPFPLNLLNEWRGDVAYQLLAWKTESANYVQVCLCPISTNLKGPILLCENVRLQIL